MRRWDLGIRRKLLVLVVGITVPLSVVGALDLRNVWQVSRAQLTDSVKQQVELTAVALEGWLDAQKKSLTTISTLADDSGINSDQLREILRYSLKTRQFWMDLRVVDRNGKAVVVEPAGREPPAQTLIDYVISEMQEHSWVVLTDRTQDETRPLVLIAVPVGTQGAVIARVDGAAINELFSSIEIPEQVVISVQDSYGRLLYRRTTSAAPNEHFASWPPLSTPSDPTERASVVELTSPIDGIKRVYGVAPVRGSSLIAKVGIPSATLYEPARLRLRRYAFFGMGALLLAIAAALAIERSIVIPVRRLSSAAHRLGEGELTARAPRNGGGEIGDLGLAFNKMAGQIAEREERLTELHQLKSEFVSSVSHELRTPLTTIKILAHVLQQGSLSDQERSEYLKTISSECDRQIDLVSRLLDLSRIEAGAYQPKANEVNVVSLICACIEIEKHIAEARHQRLESEIPPHLPPVKGDREAFRRVLNALIENAMKYTPEGGRILVSARPAGDDVAIEVADNGPGISAGDLPHIFDKFYRGRLKREEDRERKPSPENEAIPGVGLGLYLARRITEQLGGRISVKSEPGLGSVFTLYMRAWPSASEPRPLSKEKHGVEAVTGSR